MSLKKAGTTHKYPISYASYNRMFKLLLDPNFKPLMTELHDLLDKNKQDPHTVADVRRIIAEFIDSKKYPRNWIEPVFNIAKTLDLDFPLEDGISLKFNDYTITANNPESFLLLSRLGALKPDKKIVIEVTSNASVSAIARFIKQYKAVIERIQEDFDFPEHYEDRKSEVGIAYIIYSMMKQKDMTFGKVADSSEMEERGVTDENTIKDLYYRYYDFFTLE